MAFVVMSSTMSFSVNKHYCMDMLVDVSFVLPADTCGMDRYTPDMKEGVQLRAVPCCADEHIAFEGQGEIELPSQWTPGDLDVFVAAFVYSYHMLFSEETIENPQFRGYSPPLIVRDLPVIYETYLI